MPYFKHILYIKTTIITKHSFINKPLKRAHG